MGRGYSFEFLKDDLSLPAWLTVGAVGQVIVSLTAPAKYHLVPVGLTISILTIDLITQLLGWQRNVYLKDALIGRHSVLFPNEDGSRPETMADKPVAMFMLGIRSNQ
jgi:hypothetical protein